MTDRISDPAAQAAALVAGAYASAAAQGALPGGDLPFSPGRGGPGRLPGRLGLPLRSGRRRGYGDASPGDRRDSAGAFGPLRQRLCLRRGRRRGLSQLPAGGRVVRRRPGPGGERGPAGGPAKRPGGATGPGGNRRRRRFPPCGPAGPADRRRAGRADGGPGRRRLPVPPETAAPSTGPFWSWPREALRLRRRLARRSSP